MSYVSAATRLVQLADQCTQFEFGLRVLADGLDAKLWGAAIHGAIRDMATEMGRAASAFGDAASTMRREGDNVAGAHEVHPDVPTDPIVIFA